MIRKIYLVRMTCMSYPGAVSYHRTLRGAYEQTKKIIKEVKKRGEYRRRSMKQRPPVNDMEFEEYNEHHIVAKWSWIEDHESNTEDGHDYWDTDEWMEVVRVEMAE